MIFFGLLENNAFFVNLCKAMNINYSLAVYPNKITVHH